MPPEGSNHDRGHKFPFLANQIFAEGGKGVEAIVDHFFYSLDQPASAETEKATTDKQELDQSIPKTANPFKTMGLRNENAPDEDNIEDNTEENFERQTLQEEAKPESPVRVDNDDDDDAEFHDFELQLNEDTDLHVFSLHTIEGEDKAENDTQAEAADVGIFQNIQNLVGMLGGSTIADQDHNEREETKEKIKKDRHLENPTSGEDLLAKLMDKNNVRKSFEAKLVTDDDEDEIIIVHEEGAEEDEDDFFVGGQQPNFEQIEENDIKEKSVSHSVQVVDQPESHLGSSLSQVANPFKDNLFNSE